MAPFLSGHRPVGPTASKFVSAEIGVTVRARPVGHPSARRAGHAGPPPESGRTARPAASPASHRIGRSGSRTTDRYGWTRIEDTGPGGLLRGRAGRVGTGTEVSQDPVRSDSVASGPRSGRRRLAAYPFTSRVPVRPHLNRSTQEGACGPAALGWPGQPRAAAPHSC